MHIPIFRTGSRMVLSWTPPGGEIARPAYVVDAPDSATIEKGILYWPGCRSQQGLDPEGAALAAVCEIFGLRLVSASDPGGKRKPSKASR